MRRKIALISLALLFATAQTIAAELPLNEIKMPPGFHISVFADNVPDVRSMTLGQNDVIYVGTRNAGNVYAMIPEKNFSQAKKVITLLNNLELPNGVAFHGDDLYVAEIDKILRYSDVDKTFPLLNQPTIIARLPNKPEHGWRYIKFGPDGKLYVSIGAPCNACVSENPIFATIIRMNADGSDQEIYASGVRNAVGFAWNPLTKVLWFTNNGRDGLGDRLPPDQLNRAAKKGLNFGFPYYNGRNLPDPEFGKLKSANDFTFPSFVLPAHVAPLGMIFYTGKMFPKKYQNQIFIAEHGSWNRSKKIGYQVIVVYLRGAKVLSWQPFVQGFLQGQKAWGRPVDILQLPDGSILISDDEANVIYRVYYDQKE